MASTARVVVSPTALLLTGSYDGKCSYDAAAHRRQMIVVWSSSLAGGTNFRKEFQVDSRTVEVFVPYLRQSQLFSRGKEITATLTSYF